MNQTSNSDKEILIIVFEIIYVIIILVGTLANVLAFIIFSRKKFENTLFSTYFRVLLIVDTFGLVYLTLSKYLHLRFNINVRDLNPVLCKLTMPIAYSVPSISAHLTVIISFDRWLSIAKPTALLIRKKRKFQLNVCFIIVLVNFVYNGQLFFSYMGRNFESNTNLETCLIYNENLLSIMDLINSAILPFTLMFAFTLLTVNAVFVSRNRIRNAVLNPRIAAINGDLMCQYDISRNRDIRIAINSILLNFIFLFLNAPQSIFFFISKIIFNKSNYSTIYIQSALILSYLNHASVFFINIVVNTQFREELLNWLKEKKSIISKSTAIDVMNLQDNGRSN
jgi:hypothetical protein